MITNIYAILSCCTKVDVNLRILLHYHYVKFEEFWTNSDPVFIDTITDDWVEWQGVQFPWHL